MKLRQKELIKLVKPDLEKLGYIPFKDHYWGTLFSKKINTELYLTLGLTNHRFYDSLFTCDYYLSKTTTIATFNGDIPNDCYVRPGKFLTDDERIILLDPTNNQPRSWNIWMDGFEDAQIANFIKVIEITEARMINQPDLILRIEQSKDVELLSSQANAVKKKVVENQVSGNYSFVPPKAIADIPLVWFQASEQVLLDTKSQINKDLVISLASDAFRQYSLDRLDELNRS
jgi:hypothetical protein